MRGQVLRASRALFSLHEHGLAAGMPAGAKLEFGKYIAATSTLANSVQLKTT